MAVDIDDTTGEIYGDTSGLHMSRNTRLIPSVAAAPAGGTVDTLQADFLPDMGEGMGDVFSEVQGAVERMLEALDSTETPASIASKVKIPFRYRAGSGRRYDINVAVQMDAKPAKK